MNTTERELLLAAMEGDLAAGRALCDRLSDLGDDRLPEFRSALGRLVREVRSTWDEASEATTHEQIKWGPAATAAMALEEFAEACEAAFWDWLLSPEEVDEAQSLLTQSIELVGPAELPQ